MVALAYRMCVARRVTIAFAQIESAKAPARANHYIQEMTR